jgi:hypothetical protein
MSSAVTHGIPLTTDLDDPEGVPYFLWDAPLKMAELRQRLDHGTTGERTLLLARILREARDTEVWRFTTPAEVIALWPKLTLHLGRRRAFWDFLLSRWQELGLVSRG